MFVSRLKFFMLAVLVVGVFGCVWAFTVKAETTYYRYATWQCQDGSSSRQGSATTCKISDEWNTIAENSCVRKCDRATGKCGVKTFTASVECSLTKVCKETDRGNDKMTKGANTISYEDGAVYTTGSDYCYDRNTVAEFTCNGAQWDITYESCGDGYTCDLGACVATAPVVVTPVIVAPVVRYDASAKSTFMAPSDGAILTNYPREAELQWTPITSARGYEVEVACDVCGSTRWGDVSKLTSRAVYLTTPALAGDNQFRVRVRALYPDNTYSQWSDYLYFSYKTAPTQTTPTEPVATQPKTVEPKVVEPKAAEPITEKAVQTTDQTQGEAVGEAITEPEEAQPVVESKPTVMPKVTERKVTRMSCGNSAGGDGLYSACVKDTIKLDNKINITVRTYSGNYAWLIVKGAKKAYYRVKLGDSINMVSKNGKDTISVTYVRKSPKFGVFLQIETAE